MEITGNNVKNIVITSPFLTIAYEKKRGNVFSSQFGAIREHFMPAAIAHRFEFAIHRRCSVCLRRVFCCSFVLGIYFAICSLLHFVYQLKCSTNRSGKQNMTQKLHSKTSKFRFLLCNFIGANCRYCLFGLGVKAISRESRIN